jgi:hypothetical protein
MAIEKIPNKGLVTFLLISSIKYKDEINPNNKDCLTIAIIFISDLEIKLARIIIIAIFAF